MMRCISYHSPSLFTLRRRNPHQDFTSAGKLLWFQRNEAAVQFLHRRSSLDYALSRAAPPYLFVAATTSAPNAGNLPALIQTGGLMLILYWITNFVVPAFLMKEFQEEQTTEETNLDDQNMVVKGEDEDED